MRHSKPSFCDHAVVPFYDMQLSRSCAMSTTTNGLIVEENTKSTPINREQKTVVIKSIRKYFRRELQHGAVLHSS